jgi:uncharacterized protein
LTGPDNLLILPVISTVGTCRQFRPVEDTMAQAHREFQVFAKPAGSVCNLSCRYCYYRGKDAQEEPFVMPDDILEGYVEQHIDASFGPEVRFSWHGGEPTVLGLDYFRKIVALERKYRRPGKTIANGIQTNGTLLDEKWCRFLAAERFSVGISLDGPADLHDQYRVTGGGMPSHERAMRGYRLLQEYEVPCDILCVVHAGNVRHPLEVYRFFRDIGARYIGFLPMVERASHLTVPADAFGDFLCVIFDEWLERDIDRIKVQIFEETLATALGREHTLCVFRRTCGDIPVVERNGDFFSCDHFVDRAHRIGNIREARLTGLLESPAQRKFGQAKLDLLPRYCIRCEVVSMCNGGCPKDRFLRTPEGEEGLNYLCTGYKRFFTHSKPFVAQVTALSAMRHIEEGTTGRPVMKPGRNDPCPCGSGRKYKKCCMGKAVMS